MGRPLASERQLPVTTSLMPPRLKWPPEIGPLAWLETGLLVLPPTLVRGLRNSSGLLVAPPELDRVM